MFHHVQMVVYVIQLKEYVIANKITQAHRAKNVYQIITVHYVTYALAITVHVMTPSQVPVNVRVTKVSQDLHVQNVHAILDVLMVYVLTVHVHVILVLKNQIVQNVSPITSVHHVNNVQIATMVHVTIQHQVLVNVHAIKVSPGNFAMYLLVDKTARTEVYV